MTDHAPPGRLRPLDYARDIPALLPLLRESFVRDRPDPAAEQALQRMAHAAMRAPRGPTTEAHAARGWVPFFGWVWEHAGRAVGLVAVLPATPRPRRYVLVNIVVHPGYRGQGIGRALVRHARDYIRARRGEAWLEVDADNALARALYRRLGFVETDARADWHYALVVPVARRWTPRARARPARGRDAAALAAWLEQAYPRAYQWRWPPQPLARTMRPGWRGALWRWVLDATGARLWAVEEDARLRGVWAWWPEPGPVQRTLYLAAAEDLSPEGVRAGMRALAYHLEPVWTFDFRTGRTTDAAYDLYLNLPLGRHEAALQAVGWARLRVTWWMRDAGG